MLQQKQRDADVKIIDFGLAKFVGPYQKCSQACGTLHYAAPELIAGRLYDKTADIWGLGVIAYLLVAGMLPFQNFDEKKLMHMIINDEVAYPKFCWKNVSPEGQDFVKRILIKEPTKRMCLIDILEHPWLLKDKEGMKKLEKMNKFVAYTTVQPTTILKAIRNRSSSL